MFPKDWHAKRAAGGLLLTGIIATTAFGADAPAPPGTSTPTCERRGDIDLSKMKERAAKQFAEVDTNGDGKITKAEFLAAKPPQDHRAGGPGMGGPGTGMGPGMGMGLGMGMGPGMGMGHQMGMGGPGGATPQQRDAFAQAFQTELFKELDTDHNGQLSAAEFSKARDAMHSETMQTFMRTQMFTQLDKNGDGVLTKDEFPPFAQKLSAMDTNGDGTVTRDEMKAAHAAKGAQTGKPQN